MQMNLEASGMIEFFKLLPQVCSGGVYLFHSKTNQFLYTNPYFQTVFFREKQKSEYFTSDLSSSVHPDDLKLWDIEMEKVSNLKMNQKREITFRFIFPEQSLVKWFHFSENLISIPSLSEEPLVIGFVYDVTNEKVTEENVQEQIRLFLGLFENASVGMALQDWEGGYFRINQRFTEITGYTIKELTNLNLKRVKGDILSENELAYFTILGDGLEIGEATLTRKDGRKINIYRRTNTFRNAEGKPDFYYVLLDDLTEKKRVESYILHSQKMETIGNLAANLAHDLNNYLQPIHVFSQLGKEILGTDQKQSMDQYRMGEYFKKIGQAADSARSMIHKILRFSKSTEADVISVVDVSAVIQSSIPILVAEAPKSVELEFFFSEEPLLVKLDPVRISKILGEIISGSVFSWDTSMVGTVEINTKQIVVDYGPKVLVQIEIIGIHAADASVFQEFESSFFEEDESRWAGLHLIKRYVNNWGGDLNIEKFGETSVIISLILPCAEEKSEGILPKSINSTLKNENVWDRLKELVFWIIEDDAPARESLALVLSLKNIKPSLFESSTSALQELKFQKPDFVISDYRMKDLNGLHLIRKIRDSNENLVAVLYTGNTDGLDEDVLGKEGILVRSKPISVDELYESILLSFGLL
ncbi:PAS domain S-box protein [Leptospira ognonensis]|uniref:histidine kinase n=1 Tax=Leptospira ognonensis TaxID=2484945 RepID=A0A4R9K4W5_9LEPT|nr:PAS domain S-box protein [Leptospira ognonensis]TGL61213.1 PAS domain S-box protein [Leptospira ognonensis]